MMSEEMLLFFEDAFELLAEADRAVLVLDEALKGGERPPQDALNSLFRGVHTIKGNAGLMGYSGLVAIAHALEWGLDRIRRGERELTPRGIDSIFAGGDALRAMATTLQRGEDVALNVEALAARIEASFREEATPAPAPAGLAACFPGWETLEPADWGALATQHAQGTQYLYSLLCLWEAPHMTPHEHPELEKLLALGHVLAWKAEGDGLLSLAYLTGADETILARFLPDCVGDWSRSSDPLQPPSASAVVPAAAPSAPAPSEAPRPEAPLALAPSAEPVETTIRVSINALDKLMNLVGELVLTRNQVLQQLRTSEDQSLAAPVQRLNLLTTELQEAVMRTRMQPIGHIWEKFPRLVRDYSQQSGKQVKLVLEGADTELDKSLLEGIKDPLTHLVRNGLDHGLETPEARTAAGKPAQGSLTLLAYQDGGQIIVEIRDDGRGLDADKLRAKAAAMGLVAPEALARMCEAELHGLIFHPGFSTAEKVTDLSGRGVGMDVVKSNLERLGGTIEIASTPGAGTCFRLRIPLTLAVIPALVILLGPERFAISQSSVLEVVRTGEGLSRIEQVRGSLVFRLRDALIPVISLRAALGMPEREGDEGSSLVVLQWNNQVFGLDVDAIGDVEEIVVKPLHRFLQHLSTYTGVTIMGDGRPCMILDVGGLAERGGLASGQEPGARQEREHRAEDDADFRRLLLVGYGERTYALPMELVSRLEEFAPERFQRIGSRTVVQYDGGLLPLVSPEAVLGQPSVESGSVIVIGEGKRKLGLRVQAILDIVEDRLPLHALPPAPGVCGAVIHNGATIAVLDVASLLGAEHPGWFVERAVPAGQPTLLVVEDSSLYSSLLRTDLEAAGYCVLEAGDGESAWRQLEHHRFDAVISDIHMPGQDGLAFMRRLRADARFRHLPTIGISSQTTPEAVERAQDAGFDHYLGKYDRGLVLETLRQLQAPAHA